MKLADVKIGEVYLTRVSGVLTRVIVTHRKQHTTHGHWNGLSGGRSRTSTKFRVMREDNDAMLSKLRTAAALREVKS